MTWLAGLFLGILVGLSLGVMGVLMLVRKSIMFLLNLVQLQGQTTVPAKLIQIVRKDETQH